MAANRQAEVEMLQPKQEQKMALRTVSAVSLDSSH
jgi:hypothetical protein